MYSIEEEITSEDKVNIDLGSDWRTSLRMFFLVIQKANKSCHNLGPRKLESIALSAKKNSRNKSLFLGTMNVLENFMIRGQCSSRTHALFEVCNFRFGQALFFTKALHQVVFYDFRSIFFTSKLTGVWSRTRHDETSRNFGPYCSFQLRWQVKFQYFDLT